MLIGIDFDNTIVCYDRLFHALALERGLIPSDLPATKTSVRNHLITARREDEWTKLQGFAYGSEIHRAEVFPGVFEFLREAHRRGIAVVIISHKTIRSACGGHLLLDSANRFLKRNGFYAPDTGLTEFRVVFCERKEWKLNAIQRLGCSHFVDDLPELLNEADFPADVAKILFDPQNACAATPDCTKVSSWSEILDLLPLQPAGGHEPEASAVAKLLRAANFPADGFELIRLSGGRNNRAYSVATSDGRRCLLKSYFYHRADKRGRLGAEFAFSTFCDRFHIDAARKPLARNESSDAGAARLGLYEFIDGDKLSPGEVGEVEVAQAIAFVRALQAHRDTPEAAALSPASDACFGVGEHIACLEARVEDLVDISNRADDDSGFEDFMRKFLSARKEIPMYLTRQSDLAEEPKLPVAERCLSPSDFGLHNALREPNGRLRFFDFEYAGWDDPAKLLCDFFCQPDVPVPLRFAPWVAAELAQDMPKPDEFLARAELLFPAYRLKWCVIVLNDFRVAGAARRAFAGGSLPTRERLNAQLALANRMLDRILADRGKPIFTNVSPESL